MSSYALMNEGIDRGKGTGFMIVNKQNTIKEAVLRREDSAVLDGDWVKGNSLVAEHF